MPELTAAAVGVFMLGIGLVMLRPGRRASTSALGRAIDRRNSAIGWTGVACGALILVVTFARLVASAV